MQIAQHHIRLAGADFLEPLLAALSLSDNLDIQMLLQNEAITGTNECVVIQNKYRNHAFAPTLWEDGYRLMAAFELRNRLISALALGIFL
jgi:hypothetical protein